MPSTESFSAAGILRQAREWGIEATPHAPLSPHVTIGVGGSAELLVTVPFRAQLNLLWQTLRGEGIPAVLLGGGSNVAFADGLTQAVVVLNRTAELTEVEPGLLAVDSGLRWPDFFAASLRREWGGLESLAGIPGTLGGAAAVNAGAFGRSFGECLVGAEIVDENGRYREVTGDYFAFTYRHSRLKFGTQAILRLFVRVTPRPRSEMEEDLRRVVLHRRGHHPPLAVFPSAGCFFQNPLDRGVKVGAGKLIEECGLKGTRCGDAEVSPQHANFLVNRGHSTFTDLAGLAERVARQVHQRTGITLEREVIFISPTGAKY